MNLFTTVGDLTYVGQKLREMAPELASELTPRWLSYLCIYVTVHACKTRSKLTVNMI
ncbi:hypothetical protein KQQSB11_260508 [Klebsiella quasipneumoniae subsp. quasipneumoniae]|nr:hypothetical protein KQQSB11_260508 [Klebsiella quasipneumoniae subsp. quasipneumoniae]